MYFVCIVEIYWLVSLFSFSMLCNNNKLFFFHFCDFFILYQFLICCGCCICCCRCVVVVIIIIVTFHFLDDRFAEFLADGGCHRWCHCVADLNKHEICAVKETCNCFKLKYQVVISLKKIAQSINQKKQKLILPVDVCPKRFHRNEQNRGSLENERTHERSPRGFAQDAKLDPGFSKRKNERTE